MKTKTLLIAAVMFIGLSAVAFSQAAIYSVSSIPITTVIATGNAEPAGDITFTQTGGTSVTGPTGTITIQYGGNNVNITSAFSAITISCTGNYALAGNCPTVLTSSSIYSPGLLVISVPGNVAATVAPAVLSGFTISGVRVQINGAGLTNLNANISATGNQIAAGSTSVNVINSTTGAGIAPASVASYNYGAVPVPDLSKNAGNTIINAVTGAFTSGTGGTTVIKVGEGFLGGWSKNVGVRITVSATPPKGVTFTFPTTASSYDASTTANTPINSWTRGISTSTTAQTSAGVISSSSTSSSSLQIYYYVATDVGSTTVETLEIPVAIAVDTATASFPLPSVNFTYTVSLAPVQGPYQTSGSNSGTPVGLLAPRFAALEVGPANLATIQGSSTALLIPYAFASKTPLQFNTAMAIANTTEDPGTAALGFTGATANAGAVTFYLFPQDPTLGPYKYTTIAGSPGTGLDANGNVPSGGTYAVFLNQITPLAKDASGNVFAGTDFAGYVMIVTGFTNGHGIFVISNFTTLTAQSSLMIVLGSRNSFPEFTTF